MIPIQFITHENEKYSYEEGAIMALEGGCKWIQLRMKGVRDDVVRPIAERLKERCREYDAVFVIDDRVELVQQIEADGVHLGKNDMPVHEARKILGEGFIIGGTANTFEDIVLLKKATADYVGLGPFRFTTTKEGLSPTLGLEGLKQITTQMKKENIHIPICAIGGILLEDVPSIIQTGINGIAVSGAILNAQSPVEAMQNFLNADK